MDDENKDKQYRTTMIAALVTAAIGLGIIIIVAETVPKRNGQGYGAVFEIMGAMLVEFVVMLIAGLVLVSNQKTKPVGRGVFVGMCITMVIGFGICTLGAN